MSTSAAVRYPWSRERRQNTRFSMPTVTLVSGADRFETLDWSVSGCRIVQPSASLKFRDRIEGSIFLEGEERHGEFVAEVMRLTAEGDIGLRWIELSSPVMSAMTEYKPW
jgi:hypothetical protein